MDPYKLLGVERHKISDKRSLELLRQKTKTLWKEHAEKKEKFECKKVMEAFNMIQNNLLRPEREIHRSAKERDIDRMYNRQTKEINKRKKRSKQFQRASDKRLRERIRMRKRGESSNRCKRMRIERPKPVPTIATDGLRRLRDILLKPDKFPKAVKLLHRWVSEYYEPASREYLFEVVGEICDAQTVAKEPFAAKDALAVFSKIFCDSKEWFSQSDHHQNIRRWWSLAAVWNNEIFTDDQFIFTRVMNKLAEILEELEVRPESDSESEAETEVNEKERTATENDRASVSSPLVPKEEGVAIEEEKEEIPAVEGELQVKEEEEKLQWNEEEVSEGESDTEDPFGDLAAMRELEAENGNNEAENENNNEDEYRYLLPSRGEIFDRMRDHFIIALQSLFEKRQKMAWCKTQVERFFQDVYYKRERFTESQQEVISRLQGEIKKKYKTSSVVNANTCPLLSHVPVVDGRDTIAISAGDATWINKQYTN